MSRGDAIVILGCALQPNAQPSATLERRLREGLDAWRQGDAPEIWVCGGRRWGGIAEASAMAAWLQQHQVPAERIFAESCSLTTRENAWYCRRAVDLRRGLGRTAAGAHGGRPGADPRSASSGSAGSAPGSAEPNARGAFGAQRSDEDVARQRDVLRIVLVTCDFHIPRARRHFAAQGFECSVRAAVTPHAGAPARLRRLRQSLRSAFVFLFAAR
jgi:uncharacterized SAM-binding protein YcdF (DUF218 family)